MPVKEILLFALSALLCCESSPAPLTEKTCVQKVEIQPRNSFLFYGENVSFNCTILVDSIFNFTEADLRVKVDDVPVSVANIFKNGSEVSYGIHGFVNYTELMFFSVSCVYQQSECLKEDDVIVPVDYRPLPVKNGRCVVYNWEKMTCTWDLGVRYRSKKSKIEICYTSQNQSTNSSDSNSARTEGCKNGKILARFTTFSNCHRKRKNRRFVTCIFSRENSYIPGNVYIFVLNVTNTARNIFESSNWNFNTQDIVKPASVSNLSVSTHKTEMDVAWNHSEAHWPKQYKVQYQSSRDAIKKEVITKHQHISLRGLKPFSNYSVTVSAMPLVDDKPRGFSSEARTIVAKTMEDVPSAVPELLPGFFHCENEDCTRVMLLWKPIDEKDRNGKIINYRMKIEPENGSKRVIFLPGNTTVAYINTSSDQANLIKLTQSTIVGYPDLDDAFIILLPFNEKPAEPRGIVVEADDLNTISISWESSQTRSDINIDDHTVVACRKSKTNSCQKLVEFFTEPLPRTSLIFNLTDGHYSDFMFGVTTDGHFETTGRIISSGISWSDCTYQKDGVSSTQLKLRLVMDEVYQTTKTFRWTAYGCKESVGYVLNYAVFLCEYADNNCTDSMYVHVDREDTEYKMDNILPGKYLAWIRANFSAGLGPESEAVEFQVYVPHKNDETSFAVWIIIVSLLVSLIIFTPVVCVVKRYREWKPQIYVPKGLKDSHAAQRGSTMSLNKTTDTIEAESNPLISNPIQTDGVQRDVTPTNENVKLGPTELSTDADITEVDKAINSDRSNQHNMDNSFLSETTMNDLTSTESSFSMSSLQHRIGNTENENLTNNDPDGKFYLPNDPQKIEIGMKNDSERIYKLPNTYYHGSVNDSEDIKSYVQQGVTSDGEESGDNALQLISELKSTCNSTGINQSV